MHICDVCLPLSRAALLFDDITQLKEGVKCVVVAAVVVAPDGFVSDTSGVTYVCECEKERVRVGG